MPDYHRVTINRTERNAYIPFGKLAGLEYVYSFLAFSAFAESSIPTAPADNDATYFVSNMNGESQLGGELGTQKYSELITNGGLNEGQTAVVYSDWKNKSGSSVSFLTALESNQKLTNNGTIWVLGGGDFGDYAEGMGTATKITGAELVNAGTIYVQSAGNKYEGVKAMGMNDSGHTIRNTGTIVVDGGSAMYANSDSNGRANAPLFQ